MCLRSAARLLLAQKQATFLIKLSLRAAPLINVRVLKRRG